MSQGFKQSLLRLAMRMGLLEEFQTFDTSRAFTAQAFHIDKDMVIRGGLHINRDVVVWGEVVGNIVVDKPGPSSVLVMAGARVSDATISATSVEIHSSVSDVSIDTGDLAISSEGEICGDSEVRYASTFMKDDLVAISGQFARSKDSALAHIAVTPSRQRLFR